MMRRILISLIVLTGVTAPVHQASGAVPPFRSDRLETMAEALGKASIVSLPDGVHRLSWAGTPVSVVKNGGTVEHIGYALFSEDQCSLIGPTISYFLERYSLEADLPLQREKTLDVQLLEDGISFPRGGGLGSLVRLSREPGLSLRLSQLGGRKHLLEWGDFAMVFPADAELLLGRSQAENDRRLPEELANAAAPVMPPLPTAEELTQRPDNLLEEERGWYYISKLNANRYFVASPDGTLRAVDTPAHPSETMANILAGADLIQIDLGLVHRLQIIFFHSRTVCVGENDLKSVVIEDALAIKRLDHLSRSLALPETRHVNPLAQLQECLLHRFVKLLRGDREGQLRFVSGQLLVGVAHEYLSS